MKRIKRLWRIATVAFGVGAPVACGIATITGTKTSTASSVSSGFVLPPPKITARVAALAQLSPGTYTATPYSMLVVVPKRIDQQMVHAPDISQFKMPCVQPPMRLERR